MRRLGDQDDVIRPVWAEVRLDHIRRNVKALQAQNGSQALMAVVKADAYGHGAVPVARACLQAGAAWLGVATPEEGVELRDAGIDAPVLVLGAFVPGQEKAFVDHQLTATAATPEGVQALCRMAREGHPLSVHIKVDTGMGRLGFLPREVSAVAHELLLSGASIDGLFTHLATAEDENTAYACKQLARFGDVRACLETNGIRPRWVHAGNTAALLRLDTEGCNMSRAGIAIYGLSPSPALADRLPLLPALSLHARAVAVRRLPAGSPISYGATYVTSRETTIVALPLGYADGLTRRLSHRAQALLGGLRFPIVGFICMDQCMVDVGEYPARVGEEVVLLGRQGGEEITAEELAQKSGTINYEIVCGVSVRVPRVYTEGKSACQEGS